MSINKNDCLDCKHCVPMLDKSWFTTHWVCDVDNRPLGNTSLNIDVLDHECKNFDYVE